MIKKYGWFVLFFFLFFTNSVFASSIEYSGNNPVTFTVTFDGSELIPSYFTPDYFCLVSFSEGDADIDTMGTVILPLSAGVNLITDTFFVPENATGFYVYPITLADNSECSFANMSNYNTDNMFFSYFAPFPFVSETTSIWAGGSIFGTSTNMAATVAAGVVDTGGNLWPLFSLLGVVLAFAIAIRVVYFIKNAIGNERAREDKYWLDLSNAKDTAEEVKLTQKFKRGE